MSVSRDELIELIEGEDAKLSLAGRELWEKLELMVQSAPEEATSATTPPPPPEQVEAIERMAALPEFEQGVLERLMELHRGLYSSDYAENHGQPGEPRRNLAVIVAAGLKDRREGRQIDPDMTPERAALRLREASASEEAPESPEPRSDRPGPSEASGEAESGSERPWWRFWS